MSEDIEFEVGGVVYRASKLNAFAQWDVARRLLPLVAGSAGTIGSLFRAGADGNKVDFGALLNQDSGGVFGPVARSLAGLSDADSRFIITTCLSVVRRQEKGGWARLTATTGDLMYQDLSMPAMLAIVWKVIEHDLLNFSFAPSLT